MSIDFIFMLAAASAPPPGSVSGKGECMRVERALAADEFAGTQDLTIVFCDAEMAKPGFRYDPVSRLVRASRDLEPGELVSAVSAELLAGVRPGQRIILSTRIGAVTVNRQVEAVMAAPAGRPVFVRAEDGEIFSIPYPENVQ